MEMRDRRIVEILAAITFIALLFLVVFIVIGISQPKSTITNSYNTYNIYPAPRTQYISARPYIYTDTVYAKPYVVDRGDYARVYYIPRDFRYAESYDRYLRYYEEGRLREIKGIFGTDIDRYEVYVRNKEYVGGYFTVRFYFEDYYGRTKSESITHYIPAREEKLFLFKDISPAEHKYRAWWYEVRARTKAPTRVYYN